MGTTAKFLKLRSSASTIKLNEWHNNFSAVKSLAEANNVPLIAVWSNGDNCGYCVTFEASAMEATFTNWQKTSQCIYWFGCCEDTNNEDKYGGIGFNWCYKNGQAKQYPMVRIYWKAGNLDVLKAGGDLTGRGVKSAHGAKNLVANLQKILQNYNPSAAIKQSGKSSTSSKKKTTAYKVRLNEKLTVKKVNSILDAIDKNDGYCPCQPGKSPGTKCHCEDFLKNKKIGEPCICKIYVKEPKSTAKKSKKTIGNVMDALMGMACSAARCECGIPHKKS